MKTAYVKIDFSNKYSFPNTKEIYWYDDLFKKMVEFKCHELRLKVAQSQYVQMKNGQIISIKQAITIFKQQFPDMFANKFAIDNHIVDHLQKYGIINKVNRLYPQPVIHSSNQTNQKRVMQIINTISNSGVSIDITYINNKGLLAEINEQDQDKIEQILSQLQTTLKQNAIKYTIS